MQTSTTLRDGEVVRLISSLKTVWTRLKLTSDPRGQHVIDRSKTGILSETLWSIEIIVFYVWTTSLVGTVYEQEGQESHDQLRRGRQLRASSEDAQSTACNKDSDTSNGERKRRCRSEPEQAVPAAGCRRFVAAKYDDRHQADFTIVQRWRQRETQERRQTPEARQHVRR